MIGVPMCRNHHHTYLLSFFSRKIEVHAQAGVDRTIMTVVNVSKDGNPRISAIARDIAFSSIRDLCCST